LRQPSIRASLLQANLAALDMLGTAAAARIRKRLGPQVIEAIEKAEGDGWLPVEHDVALTEAIEAELGRLATRAWARNAMLRTAEQPLLSPILRSARTVFGLTPHGILRVTPQLWNALYRDCGHLTYEREEARRARVELFDAAPAIARSTQYLEGVAGVLEGTLELAGEKGHVAVAIDAIACTASFACRW
jgi:hypothetical protein